MKYKYYLEVSGELELVEDMKTLQGMHPQETMVAMPLASIKREGVELDLYGVSFI